MPLLEALVARRNLERIALYHRHTAGPAPFLSDDRRERIRSVSVFAGPPVRTAIARVDADFIPIFLCDIPSLFLTCHVGLDIAFLQLLPPTL
jgi:acyl-CoA hydrolase